MLSPSSLPPPQKKTTTKDNQVFPCSPWASMSRATICPIGIEADKGLSSFLLYPHPLFKGMIFPTAGGLKTGNLVQNHLIWEGKLFELESFTLIPVERSLVTEN